MPDDYEDLDKLLGAPVGTITVAGETVRLYPAGLPEIRDGQRKLKELGIQVGDILPAQEKPIDADPYDRMALNFEMWGFYFWLAIRQGTAGMTRAKVLAEDWEYDPKNALLLLSTYMREQDNKFYDAAAIEVCRKVGLMGDSTEEEVDPNAPKEESIQNSLPPKSSEESIEPLATNGGESGSPSSESSE